DSGLGGGGGQKRMGKQEDSENAKNAGHNCFHRVSEKSPIPLQIGPTVFPLTGGFSIN
ncbi:MAG: hypothetical protein ACI91J_000500, partial [Yoonia sp.]